MLQRKRHNLHRERRRHRRLAGRLSGSILGAGNTGTVTAANANYVGGVVGEVRFGGTFNIRNITNSGDVTGSNYVGGTIGRIHCHFGVNGNDNPYQSNIGRVTNSGKVDGVNYVAGCVGYIRATLTNNYYHQGSHQLIATEFTDSGDVAVRGGPYHAILIAAVETSHNDSKLTGYSFLIDGAEQQVTDVTVLVFECTRFTVVLKENN